MKEKSYIYTDYKTNTVKSIEASKVTEHHLKCFANRILKDINRYPKELIPIIIEELKAW